MNDAVVRRTRPRDRRESILRAASEAFSRNGYHGTSMADIASSVGISSAALYRHFKNKQQLLAQTLLQGLDATLARLEAARDIDDCGDAVLAALVTMSLEFRGLPRLWQRDVRNLSPGDRQAVLMRVFRLNLLIRHPVRSRRPDLSPADVEFLAWCVLSVAVSPSFHHVRMSNSAYLDQLGALIDNVVRANLVAAGDDSRGARRRPDRAKEQDHALRPERMIVAAARMFNTWGYSAVGIEDIGAAVGVSGPGIYHHFASKADLLNEIVDRNEQWIRLYTSRAMAEGDSPEHSLRLLMGYFAQFAADQPDVVGTTVTEVDYLPAEQAARYRKAHRDGIIRWAKMLQAVAPGLPLDAARVQIQALTTIVIDAVRNDRLTSRPDLVDALVEVGNRVVFTLDERSRA